MNVPFFRFEFDPEALAGIEECLRSGWLTTGPKTKEFERLFAEAVGNGEPVHAVAVNSCTAALHLALEAVGLQRGEIVIVPTLTFAATAEVVRYFDALPVFVDCEPDTLNLSARHLEHVLDAVAAGRPVAGVDTAGRRVRAIIPVHYGGQSCDLAAVTALARKHGCDVIEDAAHAFPAGTYDHGPTGREDDGEKGSQGAAMHTEGDGSPLSPGHRVTLSAAKEEGAGASAQRRIRRIGGGTSRVSCFSFYANKTITTAEGGMATTTDPDLAERIRLMSLHGMNRDPWNRYAKTGTWDYQLVAPGFKYNMTDIAAALGVAQLRRAEEFRRARERVTQAYDQAFAAGAFAEPLRRDAALLHAQHLYVLKLRLDRLSIDRARFIDEMKERGIICSVHWRPLHMHPYYRERYGYREADFPAAAAVWQRIVSLPLFPSMRPEEIDTVISAVSEIVHRHQA
jgi:dTDP-4-amino-4,6-dideoxygalactose transaminase